MEKGMANRGSILSSLFLTCGILPLLVSARLPILPQPGDIATILKGLEGGGTFPGLLPPAPTRKHEDGFEIPLLGNPQPIGVQPNPTPGAQQPEPTPGFQLPQPNPGFQEPEPTPGVQQPQPNPGVQLPEPNPGVQQPQPNPGVQQPEPNPGVQQPQPNPGVQQPDPNPGVQQPQPNPGVQQPGATPGALQEGFYQQSCPQAEKIVNEVLNNHFQKDPTLAPALVRLFFHDCFVTGCDASIMLDQMPSGEDVEKKAPENGIFVRGFEALDEIKARLETECPGVVSCADVLAFANRDSLVFSGVPSYNVAAGRRDSLVSLAKNVVGNLPVPESTAQEMTQLFQKKGMTLEEMVVLTGAHSIGSAHCTVVAGRFRDPEKSKEIDRGYLMKMQVMTMCQNETQDLAFDPYSQQKMDSRYYKELLKNRALLESDQNLAKDPKSSEVMKRYVDDQNGWLAKFTEAVRKLGEVEVLTGNQGEIRKQCRAVN